MSSENSEKPESHGLPLSPFTLISLVNGNVFFLFLYTAWPSKPTTERWHNDIDEHLEERKAILLTWLYHKVQGTH